MLQTGEIRRMSNNLMYQKGKRFYQEDYVKRMEIDIPDSELSGRIRILGNVRDTGGRFYEPELVVTGEDTILKYSCHCPDSENYYEMCAHCVALAMKLQEKQRQQRENARMQSMHGISRGTSEPLKQMMYRYTVRNRMNRMEGADGAVSLECSFLTDPDGLNLECRIGMKRMYVIKNLVKFVRDVQEMQTVRYGQNLEFVHDLSAFTAESREIFRLIESVVTGTYPNYQDPYFAISGNYRQLLLRPHMVDQFLDLFLGKTIRLDEQDIPVAEGDPRPILEMKEVLGGAELRMEAPEIYTGQQYTYVKKDRRFWRCSSEFAQAVLPLWKLFAVSRSFTSRNHRTVFLCREDYGSFCGNVLSSLLPFVEVQSGSLNLEDYEPAEPRFSIYMEMPSSKEVEATARVTYDDETFDLMAPAQAGGPYRNWEREQDIRMILRKYFREPEAEEKTAEKTHRKTRRTAVDEYGLPVRDLDADTEREETVVKAVSPWTTLTARGNDALYLLAEHGLAELQSGAELFVDESIRKLKVRQSPRVTMGIGYRGDLLDLSVQVDNMDPGEVRAILDAYRKRRKYYRLKAGDFLRLEGSGVAALAELSEGLQLTEHELTEGRAELPMYRALYLEGVLGKNEGLRVKKTNEYRQLIRGLREFSDNEYEVPEEICADLRWYQKQGFQWLSSLSEYGLGGILADDMGLGKTLEMITYFADQIRRGEKRPFLVVAPASLLYNWEHEVKRFAPHLTVLIIGGAASERQDKIDHLGDAQIYITSYDMLRRDVELYREKELAVCVLDEAQYIKNAGTQAAKAVKELKAVHRFAMTGTPMENRLSDMWSIFDFLMPGYLFTYQQFSRELEAPIVREDDDVAMLRLQRMVTPFLLRRRKLDVLKDLPDKLEENVFVSMTAEQRKVYDAEVENTRTSLMAKMKESGDSKVPDSVLREITRICRLCDSPELEFENYAGGSGKVDACLQMLQSAVAEGHRVLVYSHYTGMLELLQREWVRRSEREDPGFDYLYFHGAVSSRKRQEMVDRFQRGDIPLMFISLKAGGTGLNLTAADMVIHCDPWWNEAAQDQATARAWRIGQKRDVTVFKLVSTNSIEEKILSLQQKKTALADRILQGEGIQEFRLDREALLEIFA